MVRPDRASLTEAAVAVLTTADPALKIEKTRAFAAVWRDDMSTPVGEARPPDRPARPPRPELRPPREMPKRGRAGSKEGKVALLHALAHIELNAVDLAWDILCRFTDEDLPREFFDDWVSVAAEEAHHFALLSQRLTQLDAAYGDLPAHDGLWQAARETADDLLARLAVVPLVLEARGLDVTPGIMKNLSKSGDTESAELLQVIYHDEIHHVAVGRRWFEYVCKARSLEPVATYHDLVRRHFKGALRGPFNDDARQAAGFSSAFYRPLAV